MLEGKEKILRDLEKLPERFGEAQDTLAGKHEQLWREFVPKRTRRLERSIRARDAVTSGDLREVLIDTADNEEVTYSDVVERGRKDGANYPGRFPALSALTEVEKSAHEIFDSAMEEVFG